MSKKISIVLSFILLSSVTLFLFTGCTKKAENTFTNPVLAGFHPDPSICRVGDDYYLVNSTFSYFPGLPVFQSKDLVNWKLIGHVLNDPEHFDLEGQGMSRGLYAPAINYHDGLFYVVCTLVDIGGNFVCTAKDPAGPWSSPAWLPELDGIDPSLFFDDDGKAYIIYNSIPPDNKPLYSGHRTIRMYEFDVEALQVTGEEIIIVNGGVDISKEPVWIEGPHIYKINGQYYLMCAEGGTAEDHSEVIFKGDGPKGPFTPWENNPILTQRHLDPARPNAITSTGHADLVQAQDGSWWAVFLGCRPYAPCEENYFNTGRETFLAPVSWTDDGWPVINPDFEKVQYRYPVPGPLNKDFADRAYSGNYTIVDDFASSELSMDWVFLRTPHETWYNLADRDGYLKMQLRPETCSGTSNPSFLGQRQSHLYGTASTAMVFTPNAENEKAGLLVFQNERHFYYLCQSLQDSRPVVQLYKSTEENIELLASKPVEIVDGQELYLKISAEGKYYSFFYSMDNEQWLTMQEKVDATFLSTRTAGGFVGCMYALYATSQGQPVDNAAWYHWYKYKGQDKVY